jgi:hypothetical protein
MMKKHFLKFSLLLGTAAVLFSSCDKDNDDMEENEEEVITTLQMTFVPQGGGNTVTYSYDDPDGDGGANPMVQQIVLAPNKTYNVSLQLLNKTVTPAENITEEVEDEAEAHRFYYTPSAGSNITVGNLNNDGNGVALGTTSTWTTTGAATGTLKVTLRHYAGNPPNKAAGDLVNSSKSATDIEVDFTTRIQ